jgi:CRP-like cAMP-binding protein
MSRANGRSSIEPLLLKLSQFAVLSEKDVQVLSDSVGSLERFAARQTIANEGDDPRSGFVVVRGMACCCRNLVDGRRQILSFLMAGDFFNLDVFLLRAMCYSVVSLTPIAVAPIVRASVTALFGDHPRLSAALRWCAQQDHAILHERIIALGRRNARGRVAFLLCEMVCRQRAIGMSDDHSIRLPLTQLEMADALGLTAVHVNRVLQDLRRANLVQLDRRRLRLLDYERLSEVAEFSGGYLQSEGVTQETARYLDRLEADRFVTA